MATAAISAIASAAQKRKHASTIVVGVAGGTGSGKTTIATAIRQGVGSRLSCLCHDFYYKDLTHLSLDERATTNFDHPDSLDTDLLVEHVRQLRDGNGVDAPQYDFATHTRTKRTLRVEPAEVIIVEGILIFTCAALRELMDVKIFVDTEADVRFIRRLQRDIAERGRTLEQCIEQYMQTVKPMHTQFVEPSKRFGDVIIPMGLNNVALDMVLARLRVFVAEQGRSEGTGDHETEDGGRQSEGAGASSGAAKRSRRPRSVSEIAAAAGQSAASPSGSQAVVVPAGSPMMRSQQARGAAAAAPVPTRLDLDSCDS